MTMMINVARDEAIAGNGEIQHSDPTRSRTIPAGTAPGAASDACIKNLCFAKRYSVEIIQKTLTLLGACKHAPAAGHPRNGIVTYYL